MTTEAQSSRLHSTQEILASITTRDGENNRRPKSTPVTEISGGKTWAGAAESLDPNLGAGWWLRALPRAAAAAVVRSCSRKKVLRSRSKGRPSAS